jgi:Zn-finger nucleic acid-binding protein
VCVGALDPRADPLVTWAMRCCPRCSGTVLATHSGIWLEDVCGSCSGRFLDGDTTLRLCEQHLGISRSVLVDLANEGPRRLVCPACHKRMTLTLAKGVQVDLCGGCGGAWLDEGELTRLTNGMVDEVGDDVVVGGELVPEHSGASRFESPLAPSLRDASGLVLDRSTRVTRTAPRFGVFCTSCDDELDRSDVNWLINHFPWCNDCARPYTGITGLLADVAGAVVDTVRFLASAVLALLTHRTSHRHTRQSRRGGQSRETRRARRHRMLVAGLGDDRVAPTIMVERVPPEQADQRFASCFRVVRNDSAS